MLFKNRMRHIAVGYKLDRAAIGKKLLIGDFRRRMIMKLPVYACI